MVLGLYTKGRSSMKFKLPKMPKVKMPDTLLAMPRSLARQSAKK